MPFYLYEFRGQDCVQVGRRPLLPVLEQFAREEAERGNRHWHARKEDLLRGMGTVEFTNHAAVIIDLKPKVSEELNLYEVEDVWGLSHEEWTPMALRLRPIFVDEPMNAATNSKTRFPIPSEAQIRRHPDPAHEFLYANHKGINGHWNWGRNGAVNAVFLWPDALEFFVSAIKDRMRANGGSEGAAA